MAEIKSSTHEDLELDAQEMTIFEEGDCWLVALDDWEISLILSSLRYAHWPRRWRNLGSHTWDEIEEKVCRLEYCLMAGCDISELLGKFDTLNTNLGNLSGKFTHDEKNIAQLVSELSTDGLTVNTENLEEAIANLTEQFIFRSGEEETDITGYARLIWQVLDDMQFDLRNLLLVYGEKGLAQIISELPISGITEAVNGLELVANCAPDVNLSCSPDVTVISGASGETGTVLPHDPGIIGGDPPAGYDSYAPEIVDETRCKIANAIVDELVNVLQALIDGNVLWTVKVGGWVAAGIIALAYAFTAPGILVLGIAAKEVVGYITDFLKNLVQLEDSDLTELKNILSNNKQEFVCILYNALDDNSVLDVKADFDSALLDHEANTAERALMDAFLAVDVLNNLYWQPTWALNGKTVEEWLDGYTGSVDCDACLPGIVYIRDGELVSGYLSSEFIARSVSTYVFNSVWLQSIRLLPETSGQNILHTVSLYLDTQATYFVEWIDQNNQYQYVNWSADLPSGSIIAKGGFNIIGSSNQDPFEVSYIVEISS